MSEAAPPDAERREAADRAQPDGAADLYSTTGVTRRRFMRASAATAGAVGAAGAAHTVGYSPAGKAQAVLPLVPVGAALAGAAVGAYLGSKVAGHFDDTEDLSGYTGSDALWNRIEDKALELKVTNEQVLSSLENTAEFADRSAYPEGMQTVVEKLNAGASQSVTQASMENAIDDYYTGVQTDVLTAYGNAYDQSQRWYDNLAAFVPEDGDTDVLPEEVLAWRVGQTGWDQPSASMAESLYGRVVNTNKEPVTYDVTLADGTAHTVEAYRNTYSGHEMYPHVQLDGTRDLIYMGILPNEFRSDPAAATDDDYIQIVDLDRFHNLWSQLTASRDRVYQNLSTFVTDVYAAYEPGDIDTSNLLTPTDYAEMSSQEDGLAFAGAALNGLGIPTTGDPHEIYLYDSDVTVNGAIYALDGTLNLDVGVQYSPDVDFPDTPLYMRYTGEFTDESTGETTTETDVVELTQDFHIESATADDGTELTQVGFTEGPTYDPADVASLQAQIEALHEEMLAMQEEAQSSTGGAGGVSASVFDRLDITLPFGGTIPGEATAATVATGAGAVAVKLGIVGGGGAGGSGGAAGGFAGKPPK